MAPSPLIEARPDVMIMPIQHVDRSKKGRAPASVLALKNIKSNLARRYRERLGQIGNGPATSKKGSQLSTFVAAKNGGVRGGCSAGVGAQLTNMAAVGLLRVLGYLQFDNRLQSVHPSKLKSFSRSRFQRGDEWRSIRFQISRAVSR